MVELDAIEVMELGYQHHPDEEAWLQALTQAVVPGLGEDWFVGLGFIARSSEAPRPPFAVVTSGQHTVDADTVVQMALGTHGSMPTEHLQRVAEAMNRPGLASVLDLVPGLPDGLSSGWPVDVRDSLGVFIPLGDGRTVMLASVCGRVSTRDDVVRRLWRRLAIHLAAGFRLAGRRDSADAPDVEAVVAAGGSVVHASGPAEMSDERELLRSAARDLDRLRTRAGRRDPAAALELWHGLLSGRWSLVEHFDSDGKRFLLARRNDPASPHPKGLSGRQRQVAFYASLGWSNSEIGYALGVSENTVSTHLQHGLAKLGLGTRAELVQLTTQMESASVPSSSASREG